MSEFSKQPEIRWSDLDPNFHVRHSVYYDWGAYMRMCFLTESGLTTALMQQLQMGPILFREECIFKREIHFGDKITINVKLRRCTPDMGRWSMVHEIRKNEDTLSAIINIDGAWIDTSVRKLALPPESFKEAFGKLPRSEDFEWVIR